MKLFALLALCVAATLASDVLDLNAANFDQALKDNKAVIVKFYAPWCGHCKSLAPIWEEVATDLADDGIVVAKVDVTVEEGLGQIYEIQGFPTLKFFKNGEFHSDYKGPRSFEAIKSFLVKKSGKPYTVISSFAEAEEILAASAHGVVVGYFDDLEDEDFEDFEVAADAEESVQYLVVSDASSASGCGISEEGSIVVLAKDGSKHVFEGEVEDELAAFVGQHAFPQSMDLDPELFQSMLAGNIIIVNAFDYEAEGAAEHRAMGEEVVKGLNVKQMFTDVTKWGKALVRMGVVSGEVYPTFVAFDGRGERKAPIAWNEEQAVTKEGFSAWLNGIIDGTQAAWMKSEAIPETNDEAVKKVVQKQWEEIVLDAEKDVLVEFYAPWCGHCKNLAPIYESLATHFAKDSNVVIANMDATANYVDPSLGVQGFPTIIFFPAGSKNDVVDYEGDRTLGDMIEFINTNRNTQA